jgi:hypothetical protein
LLSLLSLLLLLLLQLLSAVPGSGHTVTVRCGPELHFTDLITAHEQRHGKLRPAGAPVTAKSETVSSETAETAVTVGASTSSSSSSVQQWWQQLVGGSSSGSAGSVQSSASCGLQCDLAQQSTVDERRLYSAIARRLEVSAPW